MSNLPQQGEELAEEKLLDLQEEVGLEVGARCVPRRGLS